MNILIPHKWLLEHLDTQATTKQIQETLSLSGPSVEHIYTQNKNGENLGDEVFDIEVTTNRVDSMSMRGIAREAAVILNEAGIPAQLKPLELKIKKDIKPETEELPLPEINNDPDLSKRLLCVVLKNVKRTPTPDWMGQRLIQTEMNVHDSVIDITNYVTHDLGHPCHAFDYDKLMNTGGVINIVEAQKGETFTTLDGETFETVGGEVVFKNGQNEIIDLPSIKGTANTSIDENTTNVLLLLESIMAPKVRFASMTHAIRTMAAQLMEKNVDPNLAETVLLRGIELYRELCHAQVASHIIDEFPGKTQPAIVEISSNRLKDYLGIELESKKIVTILEKLECKVEVKKDGSNTIFTITPPTFRPDITIPADIVEEIARIYGYHNLPSVLMPTAIPTIGPKGVDFALENKIKRFLANIGWQEIYSYSMVSDKIALESGHSLDDHLKLSNPLTEDRVHMRRSLIPSLEEIITQNPQRQEMSVFEMAMAYHPQENNIPDEELHLTMVSNKNYRQVKGELGSLLRYLYLDHAEVVENKEISNKNHSQTATLYVGNQENREGVGQIYVLNNGHIAIDLLMSQIIKVAKKHPTYQALPTTAMIVEDLTFTLPAKTKVGNIIKTIAAQSDFVYKIELKDIYNQNYSFTITYWDHAKNLSNDDVEPIRKKIVDKVEGEFGAKLVGEILTRKASEQTTVKEEESVSSKKKDKNKQQEASSEIYQPTNLIYMDQGNL